MMASLVLALVLSFLTMAVGYLLMLCIASFFRKKQTVDMHNPTCRFAVIVPAHDEENGIVATLTSIQQIAYPKHDFEIVVIADNCSDNTASVAKLFGVRCLERFDNERRGKGYALEFAFNSLLQEEFDAYVVVDADNFMSSNFLAIMNHHLRRGQSVVQSNNIVRNKLQNAMTWMLAVGNAIENSIYSRGKACLSLSCPLRGTGMCFSAEVLTDVPWDAKSVAEDSEYGLKIIEKGYQIYFAEEAEVSSDAPANLAMLAAQRIRWASGNMKLTKSSALKLMLQGLRTGKIQLMDEGWSMLIRSKPLLLAASVVSCMFSLWLDTMVLWNISILFLFLVYICCGVWNAGISRRSLRLTLAAPFELAWLVGISLLGVFGFRETQWTRTGRE